MNEYHAFINFYKAGKNISKTIDRKIGKLAAEKGSPAAEAAARLEISWYFMPDKARVFLPNKGRVYFFRINYKPYYMNKKNEAAGIITSYTPEFKLIYTRQVK